MALVQTLILFFSSISVVLMPHITQLKENNKIFEINNMLNLLYGLVFYLISPFLLILSVFPKQILSLIYGSEYILGSSVLIILSLFAIFNVLLSFNLTFLNSFGLVKKISFIILPFAFLNLISNIILIKFLGLVGIAIGTILSWIFLLFFSLRYISLETKFKLDKFKLIKILVINFIFIFLILFLKQFNLISNYYLNSLFILIIGFSFYFIFGYIFKIYLIEELYLFIPNSKIKVFIKKIHKKYFNFLK